MHLDKLQCNTVLSAKKTGNTSTYTYTFINAKNLFKMPNMPFLWLQHLACLNKDIALLELYL